MSLELDNSFWGNDSSGKPSPRGDENLAPSSSAASSATSATTAPAKTVLRENRRYPRFKCEGSLELKTDGSTLRTWATFTDISMAGCYVEMMTTFPVGTKLEMQLGMNGFLVNTEAMVRVSYPFLGMGIEFTAMSDNAREQLTAMLASLSILAAKKAESAEKRSLILPPISEPGAVIDALVQFFETKATLNEDEFVRLVKDSQQRSM